MRVGPRQMMEEKSPAIAIIGPKPDNFGLLPFPRI
jgi:hypothetical protein